MSNKPTKPNKLNAALLSWCRANQVDATSLAKSAGFTYLHAWRLLSGKSPVTAETLGRFVLAYGAGAAGELVNLAELATETLLRSDSDVLVAPVVTISQLPEPEK